MKRNIFGKYEIEKGYKCFVVFEYETIEQKGFPINSKGFETYKQAKAYIKK